MKRPNNFKLGDQNKHELQVGEKGQKIIYLKPNENLYLYIEGTKKLRALKKWIDKALAYAEIKP